MGDSSSCVCRLVSVTCSLTRLGTLRPAEWAYGAMRADMATWVCRADTLRFSLQGVCYSVRNKGGLEGALYYIWHAHDHAQFSM